MRMLGFITLIREDYTASSSFRMGDVDQILILTSEQKKGAKTQKGTRNFHYIINRKTFIYH